MLKEKLKGKFYFDKFGNLKVVGRMSQLAYPIPFGYVKKIVDGRVEDGEF